MNHASNNNFDKQICKKNVCRSQAAPPPKNKKRAVRIPFFFPPFNQQTRSTKQTKRILGANAINQNGQVGGIENYAGKGEREAYFAKEEGWGEYG